MKLFFFDTETTWTDEYIDQIIQFWGIFWEYNINTNEFKEIKTINQYINIKSKISPEAYAIHHISNNYLKKYNYIDHYILDFLQYFKEADIIIGHNVEFDRKMVKWECRRLWIDFEYDKFQWIDTMKPTTKLVGARRSNWSIKWPKLSELYQYLFHVDFEWAHDALSDIKATKDCFLELIKNYKIYDISSYTIKKNSEIEKEKLPKKRNYVEEKKELLRKINQLSKWENNQDSMNKEKDLEKWIKTIEYKRSKYIWEVKDLEPNWKGGYYSYEWKIKSKWNYKWWLLDWYWITYIWDDIEYEWMFKDWEYEWEGKSYYKWEIEYEWMFKDWLYNWKWKQYYDWKLEYEWEFRNWDYDWYWTLYDGNWKKIYEWRFLNWRYSWKGTLFYKNWKIKYQWEFIQWHTKNEWEIIHKEQYQVQEKEEENNNYTDEIEDEEDAFFNQEYNEDDDVEFVIQKK